MGLTEILMAGVFIVGVVAFSVLVGKCIAHSNGEDLKD